MAHSLISSLYRAISQQQKVVADQEESARFLQEANTFVDVEKLMGITMRKETERLDGARGILFELNSQLSRAIEAWKQLASSESGSEHELPWPDFPDGPPQQPIVEKQPSPGMKHDCGPNLDDSMVGAQARYAQQWEDWMAKPTINYPSIVDLSRPTPWWMHDSDHYGLCLTNEQGQLENSGLVAQFNRAHAPAPRTPPAQSFAQEVRLAHHRHFHHPALPPPPTPGVHLSYSRKARSCSEDFWFDEEFDPEFWQKNLRPGNIWTDAPRFPIPEAEEDNLSPRTTPLDLRGARQTANSRKPYPTKTLQVGGTDPSSYFSGSQQRGLGTSY